MEDQPLNNPWTFYYTQKSMDDKEKIDYEAMLHKIGKFDTVFKFWEIFSHMNRADKNSNDITLSLFRNDTRPMWEDEENKNGGSFLIRFSKNHVKYAWEKLVLNLIGEQLPPDVIGIDVTTRVKMDLIHVWHQTSSDKDVRMDIFKSLVKILDLPIKTKVDYTPFSNYLLPSAPKSSIQYLVDQNGPVEKVFTKPFKPQEKQQQPQQTKNPEK